MKNPIGFGFTFSGLGYPNFRLNSDPDIQTNIRTRSFWRKNFGPWINFEFWTDFFILGLESGRLMMRRSSCPHFNILSFNIFNFLIFRFLLSWEVYVEVFLWFYLFAYLLVLEVLFLSLVQRDGHLHVSLAKEMKQGKWRSWPCEREAFCAWKKEGRFIKECCLK